MTEGGAVIVNIGDVLAEKYKVERVLGVGGMGSVVAARHLELGELRAVKLMLPEVAQSPQAVARFLREARAVARLTSVHAVKVHDLGRLENGAPYIVMEHLEGSDAELLLEKAGRLELADAIDVVLQVLEALAEAHATGIVHRDLKPANLFVTTDADGARCVKILDFGIAKLTDGEPAMSMTRSSAMMGSPYYMSPEQMRSSREVDHRTDLWSIGVILYQLTTGALPFEGETLAEQGALVLGTLPDPPSTRCRSLTPAFDAVVLRCLARDPAARYANVLELARALAPFARVDSRRSLVRIERWSGASASALDPSGSDSSSESSRADATVAVGVSATLTGSVRPPPSRWWWLAAGVAVVSLGTLLYVLRQSSVPSFSTAAASSNATEIVAPATAAASLVRAPESPPPTPSAVAPAPAPSPSASAKPARPVRESTRVPAAPKPSARETAKAPAAGSSDPFGWGVSKP